MILHADDSANAAQTASSGPSGARALARPVIFRGVRGAREPLRRFVAALAAISVALSPQWAWGGETNMTAVGKAASSFGRSEGDAALARFPTLDSGSLAFEVQGTPVTIDPAALSATGAGVKRKWTAEDIEALKGLFNGDDEAGTSRGEDAREALFGDGDSIEGQVHGLLVEEGNRVNPDAAALEGVLAVADQVIGNIDSISAGFADCSADTYFQDVTNTKHLPQYVECEQVLDRSSACTLVHSYRAGVIRYLDGPYNIASCGEGCTEIWLGKVGNNYIPGGSCSLHEEEILFKVINPDAIIRAELDYAAYDDQMQVWIGPKGSERKVYQGPKNTFPYRDDSPVRVPGVACELGTHWIWDPYGDGYKCTESACQYVQQTLRPVDITSHIRRAGRGGDVRFYLRDAIGGSGEAFARMRIHYDPSEAIVDDAWTPSNCLEAAVGIQDGFAKGTARCVDMPAIDAASGCAPIDGTFVCSSHLNPSPLSKLGISNLCRRVAVDARFTFYKGAVDWAGQNGSSTTESNAGGALDKCEALEARGCTFVRAECTEGAEGASGTCYVNEAVYDCGRDVPVKDTAVSTVYDCPGGAACLGDACLSLDPEGESGSFAKISALLNALQYMTKDMECTGTGAGGAPSGDENVECAVFAGYEARCKTAVGGIQDCCENQNPVGMGPYLGMLDAKAMGDALWRFSNAEHEWLDETLGPEAVAAANDMAHGAWSFVEGASWGLEYAGYMNMFASYIENINSWKDLFFPDIDVLMKHAMTALQQYLRHVLTELFKDAAKSMLGELSGAGSTGAMSSQASGTLAAAGTALGVVAAVYAAYCVAVMLIQAVYRCTEDEMQLTAMRDVGNCTYVGAYCDSKVLGVCIKKIRSYCCFNSPLSRIIQEEVRKQGGALGSDFAGFGSAKHPVCGGIPLEKVGLIDWDRVDLSEWIAILEANGKFPNADNISVESLTGAASELNFDGMRVNTVERNKARIEAMQQQFGEEPVDQRREDAASNFAIDSGYRPK